MKRIYAAVLLVAAALPLMGSSCRTSCVATVRCPNSGCTNRITYVDRNGATRVAFTIGAGREAIIPNCMRIIRVELVDPRCCGTPV